jgi:hypothetical protein
MHIPFAKRPSHTEEIAAINDLRADDPRDDVPAFMRRQDGGNGKLPRVSSLPAALDEAAHDLDALRGAIQQEAPAANLPAVYQERKPTDLEQIAWWGKFLTYTDMKKFATDVLDGKTPATPAEFADLFEEWCRKNTEPPKAEEPAP